MTEDNPFPVIRDALSKANLGAGAASPGSGRAEASEGEADRYARAVLLALEHAGFEIVRHTPEPPDDD